MCRVMRCATNLILILLLFVWVTTVRAQGRPEIHPSRVEEPPRIDGILNEDVWKQAPLELGEWVSYNPIHGNRVELRTEVRVAYDDWNIYFVFHCLDEEPEKIRTTIGRGDDVFNDDWVAISLDSAATVQAAYHLLVNPSGVQMDALNTSASGAQSEADILWDSAGNITDDGSSVEVRLPLETIRFSGGSPVRMNILFFRKISRTGIAYAWPEIPAGSWVFDTPAHVLFENLEPPPSSERRLLTDFLALYEVVPGTVFHAGYVSLYEKQVEQPEYRPVSRRPVFQGILRPPILGEPRLTTARLNAFRHALVSLFETR